MPKIYIPYIELRTQNRKARFIANSSFSQLYINHVILVLKAIIIARYYYLLYCKEVIFLAVVAVYLRLRKAG